MRYFAAIDPATNEVSCTRSSKTRDYRAACAIRWDENDTLGVASFHGDEVLALKAGGPYRNRGAVETVAWEVREITKAEFVAHREGVKASRNNEPETMGKAYGARTEAKVEETVDPAKAHKLSKAMVRDLLTAIGTHVECHDGMTSKGLRARGLVVEGEGRRGMLTDEGVEVVRALRGLA